MHIQTQSTVGMQEAGNHFRCRYVLAILKMKPGHTHIYFSSFSLQAEKKNVDSSIHAKQHGWTNLTLQLLYSDRQHRQLSKSSLDQCKYACGIPLEQVSPNPLNKGQFTVLQTLVSRSRKCPSIRGSGQCQMACLSVGIQRLVL